jgi:hypothetical protein
MEHESWHTLRVAARLPVDGVRVADIQHSRSTRLDRRIETGHAQWLQTTSASDVPHLRTGPGAFGAVLACQPPDAARALLEASPVRPPVEMRVNAVGSVELNEGPDPVIVPLAGGGTLFDSRGGPPMAHHKRNVEERF